MKNQPLALGALSASRFKKKRYLASLSEDDFRDQVVRPLFLRLGLGDGRDLCGPSEEGKDAAFIQTDPLGQPNLWVVQTKKGQLNMARKASNNVVEAITQLKTALATTLIYLPTHQKLLPSKALLCASGAINKAAREHIFDQVNDPRLSFWDADDLIPKLDELWPELWLGLDADLSPYLRALRRSVEQASEMLTVSDAFSVLGSPSAATDEMFVDLYLWRPTMRVRRVKGRTIQEPSVLEIPITALPSRKDPLILVLGDAGSGKSTSIRRLGYTLAGRAMSGEAGARIPIMFRAVDVVRAFPQSLVEQCFERTATVASSRKPCFQQSDLQSGRLILFFDALDEVTDAGDREKLLASILQFHGTYPACHVVVTSRDYSSVTQIEGLNGFDTYRLSSIKLKQAIELLNRLERGGTVSPETSREAIRQLQDVHGMELNPLLVTVFAATSDYSRKDIPANITELFKKFTEIMLGRWDASKGLAQQFQPLVKDFLLTRIGYEMQRRRTTTIPLADFLGMIEKELADRGYSTDVAAVTDEILNRSALFRVSSEGVEFRHLLLQEFFAGRGIPPGEALSNLISDDWWRRALVFHFGERPGDGMALDEISSALDGRVGPELYEGSVTLGLSVQACYLVEVRSKVMLFGRVIDGLAKAERGYAQVAGSELTDFLGYYLFARDSVALSTAADSYESIIDGWRTSGMTSEEKDLRTFWIIVGLIEAGRLEHAEGLARRFKPKDARLLLAIHLGCYFAKQLRITSAEQKRLAGRISDEVAERVKSLRDQLIKELKSELLEVRAKKVKALPPVEPS